MKNFEENVPLSNWSSYRIGGPAKYFIKADSIPDLKHMLGEWDGRLFILGGGTNLIFDDTGFDGLVIKPNFRFIEQGSATVKVGAGVPINDLLRFAVERGLSGLEWAGGLPGEVGGAIRGNAGCFGGEIKDIVKTVQSFDTTTLEPRMRMNTECRFGYRSSIFKELGGREIIIAATLELKFGDPEQIRQAIQEKIDYRMERHPMEYPNVGSIFKNVPVTQIVADRIRTEEEVKKLFPVKIDPFPVVPTAYLIAEAGLKGVSFGGAMVSPKHPNFIVNACEATASEVKQLAQLVKDEVKNKFGIILEEEVGFVS